jgi:hypothetical protein
MSLTALRQAAFSARRTFTVASSDSKRPDGSDAPGSERAGQAAALVAATCLAA